MRNFLGESDAFGIKPYSQIHFDELDGIDWAASGIADYSRDPSLDAIIKLMSYSSSPMVIMLGPRGMLIANAAAQSLIAETVGAVNGRSIFDVLPGKAGFYEHVIQTGLAGKSLRFQECPVRLVVNGASHMHWFNIDFVPLHGVGGMPLGVVATGADVTSAMHRIHDLVESEQRLRLALDGAGMVGIWSFEIATGVVSPEPTVARIHGLSSENAANIPVQRFIDAIHPDDRELATTSLATAIKNRTVFRCQYRRITDEGDLHWFMISAKPSFDESGELVRFLGVTMDVTDQVETASALATSRFHFQTLTEALPQIVWSCDGEGHHDYFSARWSEFTGIEPEDITEDTWKFLIYPDHAPMVAEVWENAMRTGTAYDIDYRFRHRSGEYRWLRVMALPIRDENGKITRWFGTSTDIHESYLLAEERESFARELERIANEDALTGVLTRRAFTDRVASALAANPSPRRRASFLMLDIDRFKSINDTYGHPVGDKVLAATAQRLRAAVREQDLVGRLGGEEFAVYLPQCTKAVALEVAERIRASMENDPVTIGGGKSVPVTVSIGVTTGMERGLTLENLFHVADKALYDAKIGGRNRSVFSTIAP